MRAGGQTTVIQRVLERRAQQPPTIEDDTSSTIAVMLRCLPPPRALLAIGDRGLCDQIQSRVAPDMLDFEVTHDDTAAIDSFRAEFRPIVLTDSLEVIRCLRSQQRDRVPFILYVSELDEGREREAGLIAGADDCIGRRSPEAELRARVGAAHRIAELEAVLRIALIENRKLSTTDDLTRVASRRFFRKHFPREVERAARYGRALSLVLCDIDFFKAVNDTLGHAGGDQVLAQFGARLQQLLRRGVDWVARIGGEEFAIVLPETGYEPALEAARKLRCGIAQQPFTVDGKQAVITASFGLCGLDRVPLGERRIPEHMLKVADAALYKSKHAGRNRVTATVLQNKASMSQRPPEPVAKSRAD
jgi:two-component system, cell cycle response regulator